MQCNMGTIDRIIRIIVGIGFVVYSVHYLNPMMALPSIVIAYTVGTRWCLFYHLMGINTGCHLDKERKYVRTSITEGISISLVFFLLSVIIYLTLKYIIQYMV